MVTELLARLPSPLVWEEVRLRFSHVIPPDDLPGRVPTWHFRILLADGRDAGHINYRPGDSDHILHFAGHIGYGIREEFRGHRYSLQACRALVPIVFACQDTAILTCDPDNHASGRIIGLLGAEWIEDHPVSPDDPAWKRGHRMKRIFRWARTAVDFPMDSTGGNRHRWADESTDTDGAGNV